MYNARKRGEDRASDYFKRTENVAGVKDMRFQALMPDILHWLGITKIDRMLSMSKYVHTKPVPNVARRAGGRARCVPPPPPRDETMNPHPSLDGRIRSIVANVNRELQHETRRHREPRVSSGRAA